MRAGLPQSGTSVAYGRSREHDYRDERRADRPPRAGNPYGCRRVCERVCELTRSSSTVGRQRCGRAGAGRRSCRGTRPGRGGAGRSVHRYRSERAHGLPPRAGSPRTLAQRPDLRRRVGAVRKRGRSRLRALRHQRSLGADHRGRLDLGQRLSLRLGGVSLRALGVDHRHRLGLDSGATVRPRLGRLARADLRLRLRRLGADAAKLCLGRRSRRHVVVYRSGSLCLLPQPLLLPSSRPHPHHSRSPSRDGHRGADAGVPAHLARRTLAGESHREPSARAIRFGSSRACPG
jgi:hypothetical protein